MPQPDDTQWARSVSIVHLPDVIGPHEPSGLMESAYRRLKREIIELRRGPGSSLTEPNVAKELGWSKTPVREALARLARDGLVTPIPRAGYLVSPVTMGDAADLCDLRAILQTEAAALCAQRGLDREWERRLVELTDDTSQASMTDNEDFEHRLRLNMEYEALIANGSGNARLAQAVARLLDDLERVARLAHRIDSGQARRRQAERHAVTAAIVARDPEAARTAMRGRTATARVDTLRALSASPSLGAVSLSVPPEQAGDPTELVDARLRPAQ